MTKRQILQLPFGASRDQEVVNWAREALGAIGLDFDRRVLYIAASTSRARAIKQSIVSTLGAAPDGLYGTIDGVVPRLAESLALPLRPAGANIAREHLRIAMTAALPRGIKVSRAWLDQTKSALDRLSAAFPPEDRAEHLNAIARQASEKGDLSLAERLNFLEEVYLGYHAALEQAGHCDEADLEWILAARCEDLEKSIHSVFVDDVYRLGPAQRRFLAALFRSNLAECKVLLRTSDAGSPEELALESAQEFFRNEIPQVQDVQCSGEKCELESIAALSERQEARAMVRRIKKLHHKGEALSEMAACMVTHDQQVLLQRELQAAGVPFRSQHEVPLSQAAGVNALLTFFRVIAEGGEREAFLAALRSPWLVRLSSVIENAATLPSGKILPWSAFVQEFAALARKAKVVGALSGAKLSDPWLGRIETFIETSRKHPERPISEREAERFTLILECARLLLDACDGLLKGARPERLHALDGLINVVSLEESVQRLGKKGQLAPNLLRFHGIAAQQFRDALSTFLRTEQAFPREGASSLAEILSDFRDELDARSLRPYHESEGVLVGGLLDARDVDFQHLMIGGLNDGELPFVSSENLYLPQRAAKFSSNFGKLEAETLAGESEPLTMYRHLLRSALRTPRRTLLVTMARVVGGAEVGPSIPLREAFGPDFDVRAFLKGAQSVHEALGPADAQAKLAQGLVDNHAGGAPYEAAWTSGLARGAAVNLLRDDVNTIASAFEGGLADAALELAQRKVQAG
ncbi:MAG: hypothetical protein KDB07_03495, partial [Planctomycetes bacterium]|nr:hypothetical protein [Planctomycetota bacterium]